MTREKALQIDHLLYKIECYEALIEEIYDMQTLDEIRQAYGEDRTRAHCYSTGEARSFKERAGGDIMKTVFTKLTPRSTTEAPTYMSRLQFTEAYYIPEEYRNRIIIVDFKEEEKDAK